MLLVSSVALALPAVDEPVRTGAASPDEAALVVGIEDYFVLPDVPHASRDAEAFAAFLRHTRGVPADRIRRLDRASREQILAALDELAADVVWVYFAGHGAASPSTGERILLGADAQPDLAAFESRAVSVAELRARIGGRAVLVLDTCYNGFGRAGAALLEGKRFAVPAWAEPMPDTIEWAAAGPDEWSGVLPGADHGAFTWAVLGALRGWADADGDATVTLDEAQAWVARALPAVGVVDQHPHAHGPGDFVLSVAAEAAPPLEPAPAEAPVVAAAAPAPAQGTRLGVVSGTGDPAVLEQNLARELARRVDRGWTVDEVRFEARGTGFGIGATAGLQAWVTCAGEVQEVLLPPTGGTGSWSYHARRLAKRVTREVPCE
jgi:hypothetical protein